MTTQPRAIALVVLLQPRIGDAYVLGVQVPKDDPKWVGPWDCAEIASWGAFQVTGKLVGCTDTGKAPARADAYSGAWARDAQKIPGIRVSPEVAANTPGAVLVRTPAAIGVSGHVAISTGKGGTIEAHSTPRGVIASTSLGRRWDHGVLVPGLAYDVGAALNLRPPPVLRAGARGESVKAVQLQLVARGFDPGVVDGIFGQRTAVAVAQFQSSVDLVPDGEVGPLTLAALGLL